MLSEQKKTEQYIKYFLLGITVIAFIIALQFTLANIENPRVNNVALALPFVIFLTPYLAMSLFQVKRVESKMEVVPRFLRDIVDNVESGMDIISSIKATTSNEYGVLNEDIEKLANQLSWGVDFEIAFLEFSNNVESVELQRDFRLVIEARRIGGHAEKILRELSLKIGVDNLRKKERRSNLASNTFTGYISFLIFIVIIVLVYNNLFLGLDNSLADGGSTDDEFADLQLSDSARAAIEAQQSNNISTTAIYLSLLIFLSYELAILSGFLFGLMQENNIIAGAPHVVILVVMTFLGFFFFIQY